MKDLSFNSGIEPLLPAELAPFITRAVHERPSLDRLPTIGCSAPRSLARPGWREDYDRAVTMARATDPVSFATAIAYKYVPLIPSGVLLADDAALAEINAALHVAERSSDADALILVRLAPGIALVHHAGGDRERGFDVLAQLRGPCVTQGYTSNVVPLLDVYRAGEGSTRGSDGRYIPAQQKTWSLRAISALRLEHRRPGREMLLARGADSDLIEAETTIDRLASFLDEHGWAGGRVGVLRLRALQARARGDVAGYRDLRDRYRAMAKSLGFEGHIAWAEAMT